MDQDKTTSLMVSTQGFIYWGGMEEASPQRSQLPPKEITTKIKS